MNWKSLLLVALISPVWAEDAFQLLRSDATGYAHVTPDQTLTFPRDHLPHPQYRIEWWYLTANLTDESGQRWGVHWTLFRQSMSPEPDPGGWSSDQVWMAHAALTGPDGHRFRERFARGGIGQAGVEVDHQKRFHAWLDDWQLTGVGPAPLPGQLEIRLDDTRISLTLDADTPWVLQGDQGYSRKSARGQASYYYSQPHIDVTGRIATEETDHQVTGQAWLDREWSSQPLAPDQPGWDWFALHLKDGHALMVYRLRHRNSEGWISGSWVKPDGSSRTLSTSDIDLEVLSRREVTTAAGETKSLPLDWRISLAKQKLEWRVTARQTDNWLDAAFPYWEGPVTVSGSSDGVGYLELTGY